MGMGEPVEGPEPFATRPFSSQQEGSQVREAHAQQDLTEFLSQQDLTVKPIGKMEVYPIRSSTVY